MADRIRLSRKKGWRMPAGARKVDRSTVFGNPFVPGQDNGLGWGVVRDVEHAVWLHRAWLNTPPRSIVFEAARHTSVWQRLPGLAGHDLACWCVAGSPCHADALLELAARPDITEHAAAMLAGPSTRTPLEVSIATAQASRALGLEPSDAAAMGSALTALRAGGATS